MLYYKAESELDLEARLLKLQDLRESEYVMVRLLALTDEWEVVFRMSGHGGAMNRVWTKLNKPRTFKSLSAAGSFLRRVGVSRFSVQQWAA